MLQVENLSRPGLAPASLCIGDGECVALMGPSGAGKTLLLRAIADLDPTTGTAHADGTRRDELSAPAWRRLVAYVPAEPGWWATNVGEHFEDPPAATTLLAQLGLPDAILGWPVARLSTGERQRLALLRALQAAPRVLLLDEPTAALDEASTAAVETLLRAQLAGGASILLVTHDRGQAARFADRRLIIEQGRLALPDGGSA